MARRPPRAPQPSRPAKSRQDAAPTRPDKSPGRPAATTGPLGRPGANGPLGRMGANDVWLFGRHPVEAALTNPARRVRRLLATAEALRALEDDRAVVRRLGTLSQDVETIARADLDAFLPPGAVHQGLAAQVDPLPALGPEDILAAAEARTAKDPESPAVVVVLDQVTDPHNVGAVLRSAVAFGALAVMVQDRHSPDETGVLAKSASGALERMPLVRVPNLVRALDRLREGGFWTVGMAADAPRTIAAAGSALTGRVALVLGSEGQGMRRLTRDHCDHIVRLPMVPGAVESLNVSNAAAVALYALTHQALDRTTAEKD